MSIKRIILVIFPGLVFSLSPLNAAPDIHIDSLVSQLRNADETSRVDLFNQSSRLYWQRSFDSSLLYATHAINLAEKTEDHYDIGIISLAIIILLLLAVFIINTKRIRQKREANELLTMKNEELETANRKLLESEKKKYRSGTDHL